jgi:hypothetical protein
MTPIANASAAMPRAVQTMPISSSGLDPFPGPAAVPDVAGRGIACRLRAHLPRELAEVR